MRRPTDIDDVLRGYRPGSVEARAAGCRCSASENRDGEGVRDDEGRTRYYLVSSCPVHGPGVASRNPGAVRQLKKMMQTRDEERPE